jgi:hypothetical protein
VTLADDVLAAAVVILKEWPGLVLRMEVSFGGMTGDPPPTQVVEEMLAKAGAPAHDRSFTVTFLNGGNVLVLTAIGFVSGLPDLRRVSR